jgi:putative PEP-CTERM system histidine kinase
VLSYGISAAAYLLLLAAGLTVWRRRLTGSSLPAAFAAQFTWSVVLALQASGAAISLGLLVGSECLRDLAWAMVLARCLAGSSDPHVVRRILRLLSGLILVAVLALLAILVFGEPEIVARHIYRSWFWGGLMLAILGLVLVEQVARNTRAAREWELKYVWLALGALFAWDLCLYSIALLRGSIEPAFWIARGFLNALLAVLLAVGLRRIVGWRSAALLSPRLVFFNATLLGAGLYVLAMAAVSYFVRELGGSWGAAGQLVLLGGSALVLTIAVLSDQFRAWVRVVLAKHLFPYRYDYRNEWQKLTHALSESGETPIYDRIAKVMAGSVNCASGGLWLRDAEGVFIPVGGDLAPASAPREAGCKEFFEHLHHNEWICDLDEVRTGRARRQGPQPPAWLLEQSKIWLIVPLICENAFVGFVALGQPFAQMRLTWEEIDLLRAAGRQVASYLAFEQAAKRLAEAHQFEALNRLTAFLMHDLRHLIAQQALVVENAARHRGNPDFFDDAILTIENSVKRMNRLMDELRNGVLTEQTQRVELADLCAEAVRRCASREPVPILNAQDRRVEVVMNRDRMLQVLEHVVRNSQDATASGGAVSVSVRRAAQRAVVEVADTGTGMDAEFIRNRLFRPFDTTKGDRGLGIGAYEAREFVRKCGGNVEVDSTPGKGTRFIINLPLAPVLGRAEVAAIHELQTR